MIATNTPPDSSVLFPVFPDRRASANPDERYLAGNATGKVEKFNLRNLARPNSVESSSHN